MTDDGLMTITVTAGENTRLDVDYGDVMARGVVFPSGTVAIEYNREAFPPEHRLDDDHISFYGSLQDVAQGTGGSVSIDRRDG